MSGQYNGEMAPQNGSSIPLRTPTVHEALQYSPFTSIAPFTPDTVPFISADPPSDPAIFASAEERRSNRKSLDALNAEARQSGSTSARLQKSLQDLRNLLDPSHLTNIQFKHLPHEVHPESQNPAEADASKKSTLSGLSPVARMVFDNTQVKFRYPSPVSPPKKSKKRKESEAKKEGRKSSGAPQAKQSASTHGGDRKSEPQARVDARNQVSYEQNAQLSSHDLGTPRNHHSVTKSRPSQSPQVVISANSANGHQPGLPVKQEESISMHQRSQHSAMTVGLPNGSQRMESQSHSDLDDQIIVGEAGLSKKRKVDDADGEAFTVNIDQREKADTAVRELEGLMIDIFEAEDQIQPDTSGAISMDASKFIVSRDFEGQELSTMTPSVQSRLESMIQKVISLNQFSNVSADNLARIQKLCENSVHFIDNTSINVGDDWGESDMDEWVQRMNLVSLGLQAGKILLRIMTAGREEKQLYSADILQSLINALRHVFDTCLIPAVEARPGSTEHPGFGVFTAQKKPVSNLLQVAGRVLKLMGDLLLKVDVAEEAITAIEFLSTRLIFVENAHTEKDSTLGVQRFENSRRSAMDVLAKVFSRYPDQRQFIFDEILTSLEKLPVTRQSARQFKLIDGKPIQLVSALLMRLIQTSATYSVKQSKSDRTSTAAADDDSEEESEDEVEHNSPQVRKFQPIPESEATRLNPDAAYDKLYEVGKPLHDSAESSARYLVKFMVQRALTATKTGDQPYRNLLDIFTEDFVNVLGTSDWPASELLLRTLLSNMIGLMESDKSPAPAKNMALDLMGLMGSGISDLKLQVKHASHNLDRTEELSAQLVELADELVEDNSIDAALLDFEGPHRVIIEYIDSRSANDAQLQSARGLWLLNWARIASSGFKDDIEDEDFSARLGIRLANMMVDPKWLDTEYNFVDVSTAQGKLAAALLTLTSPFCKALKRIFSILLTSMTNDGAATVKSRSLKSVVQLLEKDPSILDRGNYVLNHILRCTTDTSPLVRDSAIGLISKCLSLRPALENDVLKTIISRASDAAVGVRKRAMKALKDIYLRNDSKEVKSSIADALLQRIKDNDEGVSDLARQTFEEIWISPFHGGSSEKNDNARSKLALKGQVSLIVRTAQRGEAVLNVLNPLLKTILSNDSKTPVANFKVCKDMVAAMFEGIIDKEELPDEPSQAHILQTLTVFARAQPKLFVADQLQLLQPYIGNLNTTDDLLLYRSVIVIYRHVFPSLSTFQDSFLKAVQQSLLASVSKLGKAELDEVSSCLWTINGVLKNPERLVRLTLSVLQGINQSKNVNFSDENQKMVLGRVKRYIMIAGYFGKSCDLDDHARFFQEKFPDWKGTSVAGLIVDQLCPFTRPKQNPIIREIALESMGMICQAWPKQFLRTDVNSSFELAFKDREPRLEYIVLSGFRGFFNLEEKRSETGAEIAVGEGVATGSQRLGKSLVANENDGVSTCIAQGFLQDIIRIALGTVDDISLTATQVIASINRQGLMHPKECGPALVALETSPNNVIATIAFQEHRSLHEKHETMFEKEYMKAVYQAFTYQRDVLDDVRGAIILPNSTSQNPVSKMRLTFDVLKVGNSKTRKRFLANLVGRIDFELAKLDTAEEEPDHLRFARFAAENLAFFEYSRLDEILHTVSCLEKAVTQTGTSIAHSIETEVLGVNLDDQPSQSEPAFPMDQVVWPSDLGLPQINPDPNGEQTIPPQFLQVYHDGIGPIPSMLPPQPKVEVDPKRLHHLTVAAVTLLIAWETRTFLRRLWGLQKLRDAAQASKAASNGTNTGKNAIKELSKTPIKLPGVHGDKYLARIAELVSYIKPVASADEQTNGNGSAQAKKIQACKEFAELLAVDSELKVDEGSDDELAKAAAGYETPDDEDGRPAPGSGRGRKRKSGSISTGGPGFSTPNKKRKRGRPKKRASAGSGTEEEEDDWV